MNASQPQTRAPYGGGIEWMLLLGMLPACFVRGAIGGEDAELELSSTTFDIEPSESESSGGATTDTGEIPTPRLDVPMACAPPELPSCDHLDDDPWRALGVACSSEVEYEGHFTGHPEAMAVVDGPLGSSTLFAPREGQKMVVLSTGRADDLRKSPAELRDAAPVACASPLACPSTAFDPFSPLYVLPSPLEVRRVSSVRDCALDPALVGRGDCSNSLEEPWLRGSGAYDYVELRLDAVVPELTDGIRYEFALMSTEYPSFVSHSSPYNDMYVAWLESESWTGNISFDELGHPISINGVFLDFRAGEDPSRCADEPEVDELAGFAMQCHGATRWLTTTAPVTPGESMTLVFALFDLTDAIYDTFVLLDNFQWTCGGAPPLTVPVP